MNSIVFELFCKSCQKDYSLCKKNCFTEYRVKRFKKGDYIAYKGEVVRNISILMKGSIRVETVLDSGLLLISKFHKAPYAMGVVALFAENNHYRVNVIATEDCEVGIISKQAIEDQMVECRTFLGSFIAYNISKLDIFIEHLTLLTQKSLKAKLALYIFSRSVNGKFTFDKKIGDLATYFCAERPSLSRAISQLATEGIITYNRGVGEILDEVALKNMLE